MAIRDWHSFALLDRARERDDNIIFVSQPGNEYQLGIMGIVKG